MNSAEKVKQDIAAWKAQGIEKTQLMTNIGEDEIGWPYAWGATGQQCTVANRQARMNNAKISDGDRNLIKKRCQVLNGSKGSCDGCKYYPDCQRTQMRDCIDFVNQLLDYAGIEHYGAGCSVMWNHKANWAQKGRLAQMPGTPCLVFQQTPNKVDKMQHIGYFNGTAVYHCSKEVKKQQLSEYPWTHYAIPKGMEGDIPVPTPTKPTLRRGSTGQYVVELQQDLMKLNYDVGASGADGKYGAKTEAAVKAFQNNSGLKQDGICGSATWAAIQKALEPGTDTYKVIIHGLDLTQANAIKANYPNAEIVKEGA